MNISKTFCVNSLFQCNYSSVSFCCSSVFLLFLCFPHITDVFSSIWFYYSDWYLLYRIMTTEQQNNTVSFIYIHLFWTSVDSCLISIHTTSPFFIRTTWNAIKLPIVSIGLSCLLPSSSITAWFISSRYLRSLRSFFQLPLFNIDCCFGNIFYYFKCFKHLYDLQINVFYIKRKHLSTSVTNRSKFSIFLILLILIYLKIRITTMSCQYLGTVQVDEKNRVISPVFWIA